MPINVPAPGATRALMGESALDRVTHDRVGGDGP